MGRRSPAAPAERWAVRCEEYTTRPVPSQKAAEAAREAIEQGGKCYGTHEVVRLD